MMASARSRKHVKNVHINKNRYAKKEEDELEKTSAD